jgi:hypothetical protein
VFDGVEIRALSSSSTPISTKHFCTDLTLCMGTLSCWNRKGPSPNFFHKVGSTESSRMLYAVALRFPLTGTKGPSPNHEKQPQTIIPPFCMLHASGFLYGLPLRSWAVVAHRCFHFTITALIVDRGSSSRAEILWTDLLKRWHPITVCHVECHWALQ